MPGEDATAPGRAALGRGRNFDAFCVQCGLYSQQRIYFETGIHLKRLLLLSLLLLSTMSSAGQSLQIAVASSFRPTLEKILQRYDANTGNTSIVVSGATGVLYAQIINGAPFDLLLAADSWRPARLVEEGYGQPRDLRTYALGKLILTGPPDTLDLVETDDVIPLLRQHTIAIANPDTAPYGVAARETLQQLGLWEATQGQRVSGQNAAQTFQFYSTGNAAFAFVGLAQWHNWPNRGRGSYWLVPQSLYQAIKHDALVLTSSPQTTAARHFLDFLTGELGSELMRRDGYGVPSGS